MLNVSLKCAHPVTIPFTSFFRWLLQIGILPDDCTPVIPPLIKELQKVEVLWNYEQHERNQPCCKNRVSLRSVML